MMSERLMQFILANCITGVGFHWCSQRHQEADILKFEVWKQSILTKSTNRKRER